MIPLSHAEAETCAKALSELAHLYEARIMSAERMRIYMALLSAETRATPEGICEVIRRWMVTKTTMAYPADLLAMLRDVAQSDG